jgi:predicted SAM-dependent methyltransferase
MRLGLGLHAGADFLRRRIGRWFRHRARSAAAPRHVERLHIGCGPQVLAGWTNVDLEPHPGVDLVHDVRDGLPFRGVRYLFAEHFLEHLTWDEGFRFLKECRASLADDGVLRLSTPNLDWVVHTHHAAEPNPLQSAFAMNKAFRGWGHQFLYNAAALIATLRAAGFASVTFHRYGESDDPELANLERHERSPDVPEMQHVLIVEARGRAVAALGELTPYVDDYDRAIRG